jgi:mRNA interferase RelE/StbE
LAYRVLFRPAAGRDWKKLSDHIFARVEQTLLALKENPRPHGVIKLTGTRDRWRIRIGDYRVIYQIDDAAQEVTILRIVHRRDAYR